jgi:hypothetical protein
MELRPVRVARKQFTQEQLPPASYSSGWSDPFVKSTTSTEAMPSLAS